MLSSTMIVMVIEIACRLVSKGSSIDFISLNVMITFFIIYLYIIIGGGTRGGDILFMSV